MKIVSPNVGYVKRYRKIHEHWLYKFTPKNPRDRAGAWDDLIALAIYEENGKDGMVNGQKIHCKKGQLFISRRSLATLWGWGLGKVDRFTRDLQADHMIDIKCYESGSLITIVAYDLYQSDGSQTIHQTKPKRAKSRTLNNKNQFQSYYNAKTLKPFFKEILGRSFSKTIHTRPPFYHLHT